MERVTRKILDYITEMQRTAKQMHYVKNLKQEVDIGATGTQKYRIKKGENKGKIL